MKEATGELNITVITVAAIAAISAFFYAFVWPNIKMSIALSQACAQSGDKTDYRDYPNGIACARGKDGLLKCYCLNRQGICINNTARKTCGN